MGKLSITIIEKTSTYTVVECARCSGGGRMKVGEKGITSRDVTETCETCSGNGKIKISQTPPFYECGNCGGGGSTGYYNTCSVCDGTGVNSGDSLESY